MNIKKQCEVDEQDEIIVSSIPPRFGGGITFIINMGNQQLQGKIDLSKENALDIAHAIIEFYTDRLLQIKE